MIDIAARRWRRSAMAGASILALALLLGGVDAVAAADPTPVPGVDLITLVRGPAYTVIESSDEVKLDIPVVLSADVTASNLTVTTTGLTLDGADVPALLSAFAVGELQARVGRNATLPLTISAMTGLRPGTYVLHMTAETGAKPPGTQNLSIQITHPAATLQMPTKLLVERTLSFMGIDGDEVSSLSLPLRETSNQSRVSELAVTQPDLATLGDQTTSGRISFTSPIDLEPRGATQPSFVLEGEFPPGITTGTLQLDAVQLQSPLMLPFEIRTREHIAWLFIATFFGLLLSVLTRTAVKSLVATYGARAEADRVLAIVDQELADREDADFRTVIGDERTALLAVRSGWDASKISEKATAAQAKLASELQALTTRLQGERTNLETLRASLVTARMRVPEAGDVLRRAAEKLTRLEGLLDRSDAAGTSRERKTVETDLLRDLDGLARDWRRASAGVIDALTNPVKPLDVGLAADAKTVADELDVALRTAAESDGSLTVVTDQLAKASSREEDLAVDVLPRLQRAAVEVARRLKDRKLVDPAAVERLSQATTTLGTALRDRTGSTDATGASAVAEAVSAVVGSVSDAIARQFRPLPDDVGRLLDAGQYQQAVESVQGTERILGDGPAAADVRVSALVESRGRTARQLLEATFIARSPVQQPMTPQQVAIQARRTILVLVTAQAMQTLLLGIVLLVNAYVLYQAKFFGSGVELAGIFLWAFALDITLDSIVTAARTTGGAPRPSV